MRQAAAAGEASPAATSDRKSGCYGILGRGACGEVKPHDLNSADRCTPGRGSKNLGGPQVLAVNELLVVRLDPAELDDRRARRCRWHHRLCDLLARGVSRYWLVDRGSGRQRRA